MSEFRLGQHEEAINRLQLDVTVVKQTVERIEIALAEKRGERKVANWAVGLVSGGGGAAIVTALLKVFGKH